MHKRYEVTDAGYDLLEKNGLGKRVDSKWKAVKSLLLRGAFVDQWQIDDVLESKETPKERKKAMEKWCKKHGEYDRDSDDFLTVSGEVTSVVMSSKEQDNYKKFGFASLAELDGLLAAYTISRNHDDSFGSKEPYVWRSNGYKTRIFGDIHGDMHLHQVVTKSVPDRVTIDGSSSMKLFGELPEGRIGADYCFWPVLVAVALKYADIVGKEIPEVKDWRNLLEKYDWDGEMGCDVLDYVGMRFLDEYSEGAIMQMPDKTNIREVRKLFMGHMCPNACHDVSYYPVIDESETLVFCRNSNDGTITLAPNGVPEKFVPEVYVPKADVIELFRASVHGIMTNQSRTSPCELAYLFWGREQLKEGKTAEQVFREGRSLDFKEV